MFRSEGSASNGDLRPMKAISFLNQQCPLFALPVIRICVTDVSCCIALFTLQAGLGRYQTGRCVSVILLPLIRLPLVFRLLVRTCSITRYADNPAQNWLFLLLSPDNMHYLGELLVNIGIRVFQPGHLF